MPTFVAAWTDQAQGAAAVAQVVAIVVGGFWAYSKFIRGRTFAQRLEPVVQGALLDGSGCRAIIASARLSNSGLSAVRLPRDGVVVYVFRIGTSTWSPEQNISWTKHIRVTRIFDGHLSIEPGEVIVDEVLIPLPGNDDDLAYRLEFVVLGETRWRLAGSWNATSIVPARLQTVGSEPWHTAPSRTTL